MPAWLRVVFFTALGLAGLSLFVLAATSSDSKLFERWFPVLLIINQAIAAALFVVVKRNGIPTYTKRSEPRVWCQDDCTTRPNRSRDGPHSMCTHLLCLFSLHFTFDRFLV